MKNNRYIRFTGGMLSVALALMLLAPAPAVHAQTMQEIQEQINQLIEAIAALQRQLGGQGSATPACSTVFSRNLGIGSTGADVAALQRFLNGFSDLRLASSGAGSSGMETQYYGPLTAAAVSKFQRKYQSEILTPVGLTQPTGYFGAQSRAKANQLCAGGGGTVTPPPSGDDDDNSGALEGGEAILDRFDAIRGEDTSLNEAQEDAPVMDVRFDVRGGDIRVGRIDIALDHRTGGDDEPWDVFESVSIWVDDEKIAESDVSDEDAWTEDEPEQGDFRVRMSDFDEEFIVREGERAEFTVAFTVARNVNDAQNGVEWETFIPDNGIRAVDSENLTHQIGNSEDVIRFTVDEEGGEDEVTVRTSDTDPEASVLQLDPDGISDWQKVLAFELDAEDSQNDIEVDSMQIDLEFGTGTYDDLVRDARLLMNGTTFDDFRVEDGNSSTTALIFEFDRNDLVIESGETVTLEFQLEFEPLDEAFQGGTLRASVDSENIEAEGADELETSQLNGSAEGALHTLRTFGVMLDPVSTNAILREAQFSGGDDRGEFTIRFELAAFEDDVYINRSTLRGTGDTAGISFLIENSDGTVSTGSTTAALSSTADLVGSRYRIREGDTEEFTLSVSYNPTTDDFYRLQLYSVQYNNENDDPDVQQRALPERDFETDVLNIDG